MNAYLSLCLAMNTSIAEFTKDYKNMNNTFLQEHFSKILSKVYEENNLVFKPEDLEIDLTAFNSFGQA